MSDAKSIATELRTGSRSHWKTVASVLGAVRFKEMSSHDIVIAFEPAVGTFGPPPHLGFLGAGARLGGFGKARG